jgi:hypothetical protein
MGLSDICELFRGRSVPTLISNRAGINTETALNESNGSVVLKTTGRSAERGRLGEALSKDLRRQQREPLTIVKWGNEERTSKDESG